MIFYEFSLIGRGKRRCQIAKKYAKKNKEILKESRRRNKEKIKEYNKEYNSRPENKERAKKLKDTKKRKQYEKKYRARPENKERAKKYKQRPEVKERAKQKRSRPEFKEKRKQYDKKYYSRTDVKDRIKQKYKKRMKTDLNFNIKEKLRTGMGKIIKNYINKGLLPKKHIDKQIDYKAVCIHLKNTLPRDYYSVDYHIDHIRPLCSFDLTDSEQLKQANHFKNLQWLEASLNMSKGGKWEGVVN